MDKSEQIKKLVKLRDENIAYMRKAFDDRGLFGVPHGIGWGLGSEGEYLMNFMVKPAVQKEFIKNLQQIRQMQ